MEFQKDKESLKAKRKIESCRESGDESNLKREYNSDNTFARSLSIKITKKNNNSPKYYISEEDFTNKY